MKICTFRIEEELLERVRVAYGKNLSQKIRDLLEVSLEIPCESRMSIARKALAGVSVDKEEEIRETTIEYGDDF